MSLRNCLFFVLILSFFACEDNFTDPNDPMFNNSEDKGLLIDLNTTAQTIHHFGASGGWATEIIGRNWDVSVRNEISELLFSQDNDGSGNPKGIGLSMWRSNIGAGSANQTDNGFASGAWFRATECPLLPDGSYDWNQGIGSRWFMSKAKEMGVEYMTGWITSPPYFMTDNGYTFSTPGFGGYNLADDQYDDFAKYVAEYASYHERQGIGFDYISLINEPQYAWQAEPGNASQEGTPCTNAQARNLVEAVNLQFQTDGINAQLILPESGDVSVLHSFKGNTPTPSSSDQIRAFFDPGSDQYLGSFPTVAPLVAGHSYWTNRTVSGAIDTRDALRRANEQFGIDYWQTEYSILGGDYLDGRAVEELTEIDYSLWIARIIHWDMSIGNATGWSFWTALSYPKFADHKWRFGLLNWYPNMESRATTGGEIEITKNLWTLGNWSRFIRPGYQRVELTNDLYSSNQLAAQNVMASAYIAPGGNELVIVLINYSDEVVEVPLLKYGEAEGFSVVGDTFDSYTTDRSSNLEKGSMSATDIQIGRKSIVTLIGQL